MEELPSVHQDALHTVSIESSGLELGKKALSRAMVRHAPAAVRSGLRGLAMGVTFEKTWTAMGDAARLVEGMRSFAADRARAGERGATVIRLPSRAA